MWFRDVRATEYPLHPPDPPRWSSGRLAARVESNERRPACAGVRAVMSTAAREGPMREHEAERPRAPGRWHPWIKRISNVAARVSAASLLASGMASGLAARKHGGGNDARGGRDQTDRGRDGGNDRHRVANRANDPKEDRKIQGENSDSSHRHGGGHGHHSAKQETQVDASSDAHSAASKETPTPTPTPTSGGGGGGKHDGGVGSGHGGGH